MDLDFRRQWDKHVISLNVIDKDDCSGSEVVHWITEFPVRFDNFDNSLIFDTLHSYIILIFQYPMCSREYVYVRRHKVCFFCFLNFVSELLSLNLFCLVTLV